MSFGGDLAAQQANDGSLLTTGEETVDRRWGLNAGGQPASGSLRLTYFTARKSETVTKLETHTLGTPAAGTTLARMGVYSVAANGDLTLIGATASDNTLWNAGSTRFQRAVTASFAKVRGQRYAFAVLFVGTTGPLLAATGTAAFAGADAPRVSATIAGQTDLPASILAATPAASGMLVYAALLP